MMPRWLISLIVLVSTVLILATAWVLWFAPASMHQSTTPASPTAPTTSTTTTTTPAATVTATEPASPSVTTNAATKVRTYTPRPGLEDFGIGSFSLIDQDGHPVDQSILEGHITVVEFFFSHCQLACPPMTAAMVDIADSLKDTPVRFLSISVDPDHDTPERLRWYANKWKIDTQRWPLLTGDKAVIDSLAKGIRFTLSADPDPRNKITLDDGSTMANIRHPIKLFLVGPQRQLLDFCSPVVPEDVARFTAVARELTEP